MAGEDGGDRGDSALTASGAMVAQGHEAAGGFGYEAAFGVANFAFHVADGFASLHNTPFGDQFAAPDGPEIIDLQLDGGAGFAFAQAAGPREAHGGVGEIAIDSAMQGAHRVCVFGTDVEFHDDVIEFMKRGAETQQLCDAGFFARKPGGFQGWGCVRDNLSLVHCQGRMPAT